MNCKIPLVSGSKSLLMPCIIFLLCMTVLSGETPEDKAFTKKDKVIQVLNLSGTVKVYIEAMLEGIKQAPIPPEEKELFQRFASADSLTEIFIPIYMENYTDEELDAMISFYSSPAGKSIVGKGTNIVRELRKISMQWGMEVTAKVNAEKARIAAEKDK